MKAQVTNQHFLARTQAFFSNLRKVLMTRSAIEGPLSVNLE